MSEKSDAARALADRERFATLATNSVRHAGWPYASILPYATDGEGRPVFVISSLAVHTKNLLQDGRCSVLITEKTDGSPLEAARVNLMGTLRELPDEEQDGARQAFIGRHTDAAEWAMFGDFRAWRMEISDVYYVGGFGAMGWVSPNDYRATA
jgi:heme iron utilization protein